jgi:transposase
VIAKAGLFILAFCWAHVRRDFLNHAKGYPEQETWGLKWVEKIGNLYHINNQRIKHKSNSQAFLVHDKKLKVAIEEMKTTYEEELNDPMKLPSAKKLLKSLNNHWAGLTVFVHNAEIPMDNNMAERGLRGSVVGRKNYYGSGAIWSAQLAACLFTIFETLKIWHINPHTWLLTYFYHCAAHGGMPPEKIDDYLPWNMSKETIEAFSKPNPSQQPIEDT